LVIRTLHSPASGLQDSHHCFTIHGPVSDIEAHYRHPWFWGSVQNWDNLPATVGWYFIHTHKKVALISILRFFLSTPFSFL
jgi:hypothetical protein